MAGLHFAIKNAFKPDVCFNDRNFLEMVDTVHILLPLDKDVNAQDVDGNTPLHAALYLGYHQGNYLAMYDILRQLLLAGADKKIRNHRGFTPLDLIHDFIAEIEQLDNEPYLKYRDHVQYRIDAGVLTRFAMKLFL
jgi:ankyrin repeat protein